MVDPVEFTIIIPTYNSQKTILACVESVLQSGFPDYTEIIIVDDGSTDNTLSLCHQIDLPNLSILSQPNQGVSSARNRGICNASHPWIVFLDSDDILLDGYYDELNSAVGADLAIVCFNASYIHSNRCSIHSSNPKWLENLPSNQRIRFINFITTSGTCARAQYLRESSGFDTRLLISEDWDLWIRLSCLGQIRYISTLRVGYYVSQTGLSRDRLKQMCAELTILTKYSLNDLSLYEFPVYLFSAIRISARYFHFLARQVVTKILC